MCSVLHRTLLRTPLSGAGRAKRKSAQSLLWQVLRRFRTVPRAPEQNANVGNRGVDDLLGESSDIEDDQGVGAPVAATEGPSVQVTQAEIVSVVLPCLPPQCRSLVAFVTAAILEPDSALGNLILDSGSLAHIVPLLEGLTPMFSIAAMVPLAVLPALRQAVLHPDAFFSDNALINDSKELAPEVFRALKGSYRHDDLFPSVLQFVEGLLERLNTWEECGIDPPPFDPIAGSYNPELTGLAFRLTRSGLMGRVVRKYVSDTSEEAKLRSEQCQKQFPTAKFRTGGLFR